MEKLKHTKGPWRFDPKAINESLHGGGIVCLDTQLQEDMLIVCTEGSICIEKAEQISNANLLALSPTAPHSCADPECPGDINRRKLQELEKLENRAALIAYKAGLGASEYESVTHFAAVEVVKAKLQAAEEMAALWPKLREFVGFKNSLPPVRDDVIAFDTALTAWENAGKEKGE